MPPPKSKGKKTPPPESILPPLKPGAPAAFEHYTEPSGKMPATEVYRRLEAREPIPGLTEAQAHDLRERHLDENQTLDAIAAKRGVSKQAVEQSLRKAHEKLRDLVDNPEHVVRLQAPVGEEDIHAAVEEMLKEEQTPQPTRSVVSGKAIGREELGLTEEQAKSRGKKPKKSSDPYDIEQDLLSKLTKEMVKRERFWEKLSEKRDLTPEEEERYRAEKQAFVSRSAAIHSETLRRRGQDEGRETAPTTPAAAPGPAAGRGGEPPAAEPKAEGAQTTAEPAGHGTGSASEPGTGEPAGQPRSGRGLKKRGTRESAWTFEERKLKDQGAATLGQYVVERGGIKGTSLKDDATLQEYRGRIGGKMFSEARGEPIDTLADGLIKAGVISEPPPDKHPAQHLLDLLEQHHVITQGLGHDAAMRAEQEAAHRKAALLAEGTEGDAAEHGPAGKPEEVAPGVAFHHDPGRAGLHEGLPGLPEQFGAPLTPEERRGTYAAGGQEGPGEEMFPKRETALANAQVDRERAARRQPPLMSEARRSNPEVWDRAMEVLDRDPKAGEKLVDELDSKPRATTVDENALLLHRKIALANEHERAVRDYLRAFSPQAEGRDVVQLDALEQREKELAGKIEQLDKVARKTGTEWGRAGQFRKQLAAEDYELSGMLQRSAAAKGEPLTPEEKVKITELHDRIKELEKKLEETEGKVREGKAGAGELVKAKGKAEDAKGDYQKINNENRQKREPTSTKVMDWLKALRVNFLISGLGTLAHVSGASLSRLVTTPLEELSGAVLRRIPGIAKIAAVAPRQGRGFNWKAEAKSFASFWKDGFIDAWKTVRTGKSDLDSAHGKQGEPGTWMNLQFRLHDALKAPAVRAEYTRSFLHLMDFYASRGEDVSSPEALLRISADAYREAQKAKFRQENWLVDSVNAALKANPKGTLFENVAKTTGKLLLPILRIPTNLVFETGTHIFGTATGSVEAINAYRKGIENLKPQQADAIMRQFKKGSLGAAMLLLGYFSPDMFGGYYQEDEKKKKGEPGFGGAKVGPVTIPASFQHVPMMQVAQFGATIRKVQDKHVKGEKEGIGAGALAGLTGLGTEVPLIRESVDVGKMVNARTRGAAFGELAKSFTIPQLVQWLAGHTDVQEGEPMIFGEPNRRKPQGFGETLETGIPGLRQRVGLK